MLSLHHKQLPRLSSTTRPVEPADDVAATATTAPELPTVGEAEPVVPDSAYQVVSSLFMPDMAWQERAALKNKYSEDKRD